MAALPPDPKGWSVEDVKQWAVEQVGIDEVDADKLVQQKIDGEALLHMTEARLLGYGVPGGPAIKLMKKIEGLGGGRPRSLAGGMVLSEGPFVDYWRRMWDVQPDDDGVLNFGDARLVGRKNLCDAGPKLFVRDCYSELARLVMDARANKRNMVISGTPGVGKTMFRNYMVYYAVQLMKEGAVTGAGGSIKPLIVALHVAPGDHKVVVLKVTNRCDAASRALTVERWSRQQFEDAFQENPSLLYLVDVSEGDSKNAIATLCGSTVMFTSPNERAYKELKRQDCGLLYMPLWGTEEGGELRQAAMAMGLDVSDVKFNMRVERYGGVARAALRADGGGDDGNEEYAKEVTSALNKMDFSECSKALDTANATLPVRHLLLYLLVGDDASTGPLDYTSARLRFGTDYLLDLAAARYLESMQENLNSVLSSPWPGVRDGVKGDFMEAVAHRMLVHCGHQLPVKRLGHRSTDWFTGPSPTTVSFEGFEALGWNWFDDKEDAMQLIAAARQAGVAAYLRPLSDTFPAFDAVAVTAGGQVLLLQMTISRKHDISGSVALETLQFFVNQCGTAGTVQLVFVVAPKATWSAFSKQRVGKCNVSQYALLLCGRREAADWRRCGVQR